MAQIVAGTVIQSALWPQGDIRDPLGVWGMRQGVTGDATGGSIKVIFTVPAGQGAAYLYTCYSAHAVQLSGAIGLSTIKFRLLTNWPDIDPLPGVQAYATAVGVPVRTDPEWTAPIIVPVSPLVSPIERFILLFDPRPSAGELEIAELEWGENVDTVPISVEGYGYFWDRSVLQAPGGPRHPGAS